MKTILSLLAHCLVFLLCLHGINSACAQEKGMRLLVRADTLRGTTDSLARLWIAPFIDSNKVSKNWSRLERGLSQQAVRNLLGRPTSVDHDLQNSFTYWWYGREAVVFDSRTRKVAFWDK